MTLKKASVVLGILVLATGASDFAVARETYPGTSCQPQVGADAVDVVYQSADISNTKRPSAGNPNASMPVMCPIIRRNVDSTAPIRVFARIRNSNVGFSTCQIVAFDWRGENQRPGNLVTVSGARFQGVTLNGPPSYAGGTENLFCFLSGGSQLRNYYVEGN